MRAAPPRTARRSGCLPALEDAGKHQKYRNLDAYKLCIESVGAPAQGSLLGSEDYYDDDDGGGELGVHLYVFAHGFQADSGIRSRCSSSTSREVAVWW